MTDVAPGSTLHVDVPPTIAVDAGTRWTGLAARHGARALNGAVIALTPYETMTNAARNELDLDNFELWYGYYDRIVAAVDEMWDHVFPGVDQVRIVAEGYLIPRKPNPRTRRPIPMVDWLPIREINAGICARYTGAIVVARDNFGHRHEKGHDGTGDWRQYYPAELFGRRPDGWMRCEDPAGDRSHERSAWVAAGVAHLELTEQVAA